MMLEGFRGIYPAIVSPRTGDGGFDAAAFERLIDRLYEAGVHGLYVGGNTGEGYLLSAEVRRAAAEVAVKASAGRGKVVVHVGAPAEQDAVALAKHAAAAGADGVSSLPPYVQGYRFGDTVAYYAAVARAAEIPVFVYYIPVITHQEFSLSQVEELLDIEGVEGLKFTNHNLYLMEGILNGAHDPHVFNGHDEVLLAGLAMGAQGGIGSYYNVMPGHVVQIFEAVQEGNLERGRKLQQELNRVIRICQAYGGLASLRAVLRWQGIDCGHPVLPTRPLIEAEAKRLRASLDGARVNLW